MIVLYIYIVMLAMFILDAVLFMYILSQMFLPQDKNNCLLNTMRPGNSLSASLTLEARSIIPSQRQLTYLCRNIAGQSGICQDITRD